MSDATQNDRIRLDKWLKLSCIYKTRALATRACEDGKVKVNGQKAKPARVIQVGDQLTIRFRKAYRTIDVLGIVHKSISKKKAMDLYFERTPQLTEEEKELSALLQDWDSEGKRKYKGRPTKKERRDMDKFKES